MAQGIWNNLKYMICEMKTNESIWMKIFLGVEKLLNLQDINPNENDQTMRFRKKIEKDEKWGHYNDEKLGDYNDEKWGDYNNEKWGDYNDEIWGDYNDEKLGNYNDYHDYNDEIESYVCNSTRYTTAALHLCSVKHFHWYLPLIFVFVFYICLCI